MNVYTLLPLVCLGICIFVFASVFAHNRKNPVNRAFLLYASCVMSYLFKDFIMWSDICDLAPMLITRIGTVTWIPIVVFFLHFTYVLLDLKKGWFYYFSVASATIFCIIGPTTNLIFTHIEKMPWGYEIKGHDWSFHVWTVTCVAAPGVHALWIILRAYFKERVPQARSQLILLFLGSASFFFFGVVFGVVIPVLVVDSPVPRLGAESGFIQLLLVYFALQKYRFMSIDVGDVANEMFANLSDGVVIVDPDGLILHANETSQKVLGIQKDEHSGKKIDEYIDGFNSNVDYEDRVFELGDGSDLYIISLTQSSYVTATGRRGRIVIFKDITQQKETEQELLKARKKLIHSARKAGMAEVATSVLHNVGNVLNSVNVSGRILRQTLQDSATKKLRRVVNSLDDPKTEMGAAFAGIPKGPALVSFFEKLTERLEKEVDDWKEETNRILKNIEHISRVIELQQTNASVSCYVEKIDISDIVSDALEMSLPPAQDIPFELLRETKHGLSVESDKTRVLEILGNLITNSRHSLRDSGHIANKELRIWSQAVGADYVRIGVTDNGVGITNDEMKRVFEFGYTTKKDGHGFGLHQSALSAKDIGGKLWAESDGRDKGATFILELPVVFTRRSYMESRHVLPQS